MFSKTARCLLFYPLIYQKLFSPLLDATCEIEFEYTGFSGHKEVVDWSDCKLFLVQHLVFLYRAPGRHWSVEAYHAPRGNTRAWALEETLFRVCEFKRLHNHCAITRICADALTACFPLWALCAFCLFYWVITLCLQRRSNTGGVIKSSFSLFECSVWRFVVSFLQICHTGFLKMYTLLQSLQPASCSNMVPSAAPRSTKKELLNQLCSVA